VDEHASTKHSLYCVKLERESIQMRAQ